MVLWRNDKKEEQKGYCMDVFTDDALAWIQANKSEPFFLYFPANLIHSPLEVPDEYIDHASDLSDSTQKTYGMLRNLDMNFGRLMQALKDNGLEKNTLVVFTSDDGPCGSSKPFDRFNNGFHGLKGTVYEGGIRVPCYVRWPAKLNAPAKVEQNTSDIDLMPTILAACGVPDPSGVSFDGKNLLPLLENPQAPWPERNLFYQTNGSEPIRDRVFAVVSGKWKLAQPCMLPEEVYIREIKAQKDAKGGANLDGNYAPMCRAQGRPFRSIAGEPRYELYDLEADPAEWKDLAVSHPETVARLREAYDAWFTDVEKDWHTANEKEKASDEGRPRSKQQAEQS